MIIYHIRLGPQVQMVKHLFQKEIYIHIIYLLLTGKSTEAQIKPQVCLAPSSKISQHNLRFLLHRIHQQKEKC